MTIWQTLFGGKPQEPLRTVPDLNEEADDAPASTSEIGPAKRFGVDGTILPSIPAPSAAWPFPVAKPYEGPGQTTPLTKDDVAAIVENEKADKRSEGELRAQHFAYLAEQRRLEREELKAVVTEAPEHGIEFVHVGRTTFAWRYHTQNDHVADRKVIDVATAVCNPNDTYAKWHGSAIAAQNLLDGKYITIRTQEVASPRDAVKMLGLVALPALERFNLLSATWTNYYDSTKED